MNDVGTDGIEGADMLTDKIFEGDFTIALILWNLSLYKTRLIVM